MRSTHPDYARYNATHDYRWMRRGADGNLNYDDRLTWKETLAAMCASYGKHAGRWHENDFWKATAAEVDGMTETECETKVRKIERDADAALALWDSYQ